MTRDDIKKVFTEATDEQISSLLNINSADIGKAKGNYSQVQQELTEAKETISSLEKNKANADELQKTIDAYKAADQKREEKAKADAVTADHTERFNKVLGDRKFAHEYIRQGVFHDFEKALADEANKGKGDAELFDSITKDEKGVKPGLFEPKAQGLRMHGMGGVPNGNEGYMQEKYKNNPFYQG